MILFCTNQENSNIIFNDKKFQKETTPKCFRHLIFDYLNLSYIQHTTRIHDITDVECRVDVIARSECTHRTGLLQLGSQSATPEMIHVSFIWAWADSFQFQTYNSCKEFETYIPSLVQYRHRHCSSAAEFHPVKSLLCIYLTLRNMQYLSSSNFVLGDGHAFQSSQSWSDMVMWEFQITSEVKLFSF